MGKAQQAHGFVTNLHLGWTTFRNPPYENGLVLVGALAFHFLTKSRQDIKCDFWSHKVGLILFVLSPDVGF